MWTQQEVRQMLHIIKEGNFLKLLVPLNEASAEVYEDLSKEMSKHNMNRTAREIRCKFNYLWHDYVQLEKNKDYSKAGSHTKAHLNLLNDISGRNVEEKVVMSTNDESVDNEALCSDEIKAELIDIFDDSDEDMADDTTLNDDTTDVEASNDDGDSQSEEQAKNSMNGNISTYTDKSCHGYEKVVASFTNDWKNSQRALIDELKRQDLRDLRTISKQFKYQETMLRKSRLELEKTLEKDRAELKVLLDTYFKAKDSTTQHSQQNGVETDLRVKEEVEKID